MFKMLFAVPFCWNPITWIMDTIVTPLINLLVQALQPVFEAAIDLLSDIMLTAFADVFYNILLILLKAVQFLNNSFMVFAGIYNVAVKHTDGTYTADGFLLQSLIFGDDIFGAYLKITIMALILCIAFTIISIVRSMSDLEFDPRKSVGKILGRFGKTVLTFLIIPLLMFIGIELSSIIGGSIVMSFTDGEQVSIDNMIFLTCTMKAAHENRYNTANASFTDDLRKPYFNRTLKYEDLDPNQNSVSKSRYIVSKDFDLKKFDFIIGYTVSIFMIFILFGCALFAVRRILEILLLYVTAPFFVATIPIDEGKKFEAWRDMFVAKLVSCYGMVFMMSMYLTVMPTLMSENVQFPGDSNTDYLMKILLLLGGAFAIKNGHSALLTIINPTAAQHAQSSVMGGMGIAMMAGSVLGNQISSAMRGKPNGGGQSPNNNSSDDGQQSQEQESQEKQSSDEQQKFSG